MSEVKQVKVDNWGVFFLQRLKNFFNRTDYCDLTLQFQNNVQLKVHRLVLNTCTEYFEILERTCEMYEDCLIMPDDLQTDVMLPIINFMYTGQLDYEEDILEKLYQTSQIMNMTVLCKLLDVQRVENSKKNHATNILGKRIYNKIPTTPHSKQKVFIPPIKKQRVGRPSPAPSFDMTPYYIDPQKLRRNSVFEKRPTRYEVPPELEREIPCDSFTDISYDSKPLMVHPETRCYERKKPYYGIFSEASTSKYHNILNEPSTSLDYVECKRINFEEDKIDNSSFGNDEPNNYVNKDKLFDQVLDDQAKVTIETKKSQDNEKIDHAKIISEVLKKYPHLVKGNKNIRLKILPPKSKNLETPKTKTKKQITIDKNPTIKKEIEYTHMPMLKREVEYVQMDSRDAEELVKLGVNNVAGPWICMLCGAPGRYLNFNSYYEMRRHLVEVHKEKPHSNLCEYCGIKAMKRNYLLHHMYTKHGIEPPPTYHFPKCKKCNYIALTNGYLAKHKLSHVESKFRCNVCLTSFKTSSLLLHHIQTTGHKISADRRQNFHCIYCMKNFLRESNLFTHMKICHKDEATYDGIIDYSDEEDPNPQVKQENIDFDTTNDLKYEIQEDGNIQIITKQHASKQKILNEEFEMRDLIEETSETNQNHSPKNTLYVGNSNYKPVPKEGLKILSNKEYVLKGKNQYNIPSSSAPLEKVLNTGNEEMVIKNSGNINQAIQIVVSNEEEYKALISSNPSIIFDDSTQGKTLTVLSTSHASLEPTTSMNIENSQNNEMMILQQDYPISVSETVPTDNGNIVVLYDPTDNSQKKYIMNTQYAQPEILGTQDISAQYVQTSAVITQNFETITTSTPIVAGQVIMQQPIMSWPTTVHHEIVDEQNPFSITPNSNMVELSNIEKCEVINEIVVDSRKADNNTLLVISADTIENDIVETVVMEATTDTIISTDNTEQQVEENASNIETMEATEDLIQKPLNKDDIQNKILLEWPEEIEECESTVQVENSTDCVNENTTIIDKTLENVEAEEGKSAESEMETSQTDDINSNHTLEEDILQESTIKDLPKCTINTVVKEKINSLLIDWDENDSQNGEAPATERSTQIVEVTPINDPELHLENETLPLENKASHSGTNVSDENIQDISPNVEIVNKDITKSDNESNIEENIVSRSALEAKTDEATNSTVITKKNADTENNIKKLVSDWDEDEE